MKKLLFASFVATAALCSWIEAEADKPAATKAAEAKAETPVRMEALNARYDKKNGTATFIDAVKVDDGTIRLDCEKMTAFFASEEKKSSVKTDANGLSNAPKAGPKADAQGLSGGAKAADKTSIPAPKKESSFLDESGNKLERILCEKNVVIRKGDQVATAQRAEYFYAEGKIVLTGNPVLKEKKGVIRSDRITFYRDSEVIEFDRIQADGQGLDKKAFDAKELSPKP